MVSDAEPNWPFSLPRGTLADLEQLVIERASIRARDLFGFPRPDDPHRNGLTRADMQRRSPNTDIAPYG